MGLHWTFGLVLMLVAAFLLGSWVCKQYPGFLPVVS